MGVLARTRTWRACLAIDEGGGGEPVSCSVKIASP